MLRNIWGMNFIVTFDTSTKNCFLGDPPPGDVACVSKVNDLNGDPVGLAAELCTNGDPHATKPVFTCTSCSRDFTKKAWFLKHEPKCIEDMRIANADPPPAPIALSVAPPRSSAASVPRIPRKNPTVLQMQLQQREAQEGTTGSLQPHRYHNYPNSQRPSWPHALQGHSDSDGVRKNLKRKLNEGRPGQSDITDRQDKSGSRPDRPRHDGAHIHPHPPRPVQHPVPAAVERHRPAAAVEKNRPVAVPAAVAATGVPRSSTVKTGKTLGTVGRQPPAGTSARPNSGQPSVLATTSSASVSAPAPTPTAAPVPARAPTSSSSSSSSDPPVLMFGADTRSCWHGVLRVGATRSCRVRVYLLAGRVPRSLPSAAPSTRTSPAPTIPCLEVTQRANFSRLPAAEGALSTLLFLPVASGRTPNVDGYRQIVSYFQSKQERAGYLELSGGEEELYLLPPCGPARAFGVSNQQLLSCIERSNTSGDAAAAAVVANGEALLCGVVGSLRRSTINSSSG